MKKFLTVLLVLCLSVLSVKAEVQTYEGTDEYYVLGAVENINVARERAHQRALRDACEKAGLYIRTFSRMVNTKLIEDEIITLSGAVMRVVESNYDIIPLSDNKGFVIRATVHADINDDDVEKFLNKDAEEMAMLFANEKAIRQQEEQEYKKLDTLKQEYVLAATVEEKELIARQIVEEDKVFLSNLKLREGNKCRDEGDHKRAEKFFSEAIELNPENALAWHNRGWAYIEEKKYTEALADFDKASELNPDSELPYFGRGWTYNQQKKYDSAIKEYNKVIELNPKYAVAWNNRGAAKSWLNLMQEAIADYDKAIELKPNYVQAYENRSKAFNALGNYSKATEDLRRAEHLKWSNENADKVIDKALALDKRGDFKGALKLLNEAAKLYPDNQFVLVNRGNIYNDRLKDYEKAIADYNKTIELNPKFSWPYLNRAIAYGRLKRWDEAVVDYGRAIELDANYADAYNGRAWSYCQIGKFEEALLDANKALELKPNEANFFDTRAGAYAGLKRYEEALADMDKAIKLSPEGWLYHNRGKIYLLMGDETKAQNDFDKARKLGYDG
ncbi:MAG: tetratricopeptide repeat protein [Selenomonadaceae bacterium]|nr:tetratricopeptide repeat protein [Selenomonadaceae bacterium]